MPRADDDAALRRLIRESATRHAPPADLAAQLRERLEAETAGQPATRAAPQRPRIVRGGSAAALFGAGAATASLAALVLAAALAWPPAALRPGLAAPQHLGEAVMASHVRSLTSGHLTDVASSDRHTVKPWFAGKLDFAPPVIDLADAGYPLVGGRLDQLEGAPVAALVYRVGPHVVNVFVWPAAAGAGSTPGQAHVERGFQMLHWTQGDMQAWAVSDTGAAELATFVARLRERTPPAAP